MPFIAAASQSLRPELLGSFRVLRVGASDEPAELARALESALAARARVGLVEDADVPGSHRAASASRVSAADSADRAGSVEVTESLLRASERVMADIEALEAVKARVEADLLAAYGSLHTIQTQQIAALPAGSSRRAAALVPPERVVAEEIALATGVAVGEVGRRLTLATAPRRHRRVLAALRAGGTSLHRAVQVACETALLSDADVAVVEESVLAPSRDGRVVGQRSFTARLTRAIASVDMRGAEERRAHAKARRGVFGRMVGDGMGCLSVTADAGTVAAIMDRLDTRARAARGGGDSRTLDQLRCDLATEALLRDALADACDGPAPAPATGDAAARVWLVVPFEVAIGDSDAACELPGHGWVTAAHAREMMTRPGSVWQTLPVDIRDGHAISRPTKSYRPTPAMVEHVRAVDGTCRGPDCHVPATRCDLDHEIPWPAGETTVTNCYAKERRHHNVKTHGIWTSTPVADDGLEWTTLTGRSYTTYPKDWREGLGPPPDTGSPPDPVQTQLDPPEPLASHPVTDSELPPF